MNRMNVTGRGHTRYNLKMIRDFIDHLNAEVDGVIADHSHPETSDEGVTATLSRLYRKYNSVLLPVQRVDTTDLSSEEKEEARELFHAVNLQLFRDAKEHLQALEWLFNLALRAAAMPAGPDGLPTYEITGRDLLELFDGDRTGAAADGVSLTSEQMNQFLRDSGLLKAD